MAAADKANSGNSRTAAMPATLPSTQPAAPALHPAWQLFLRFCQQLGHGEIERLKIQDGLPLLAEVTMKKVKFSL